MNSLWIDPVWILPAILMALALAAILSWSYLRDPRAPRGIRAAAFACKTLAFLLILFCLLNPALLEERPEKQSNYWLLLTDNSISMQQPSGTRSPAASATNLLTDPQASLWIDRLREDFRVRSFSVGRNVSTIPPDAVPPFEATESNLGMAFDQLRSQFSDLPVAGILLLSDGVATDSIEDLSGLPPVFPVDFLPTTPPRDLAVGSVTSDQSPFEDALININADITANGLKGKAIQVTLSDGTQKILETKQLEIPSATFSESLEFETKPYKLGPQFFRVSVGLASDQKANEEIVENNQREVVVNRRPTPYRVLYVAGRPNWDHKFLQRALKEDRQIDLVSLLRIANRAPKFEFRDDSGGAANPLFESFNEEDEETRYDEPVFVRLNVATANELANGLPSLEEDLFAYDAIILDDIEADFFTPDQSDLIRDFVRERGGGLLMLGGLESFKTGGYEETPIGNLLPVTLGVVDGPSRPTEMRLSYSREGILQPWMRLRSRKADEEERIATLPAFRVLNQTEAARPGASVFAVVEDYAGQQLPAIAGHRVGNGKVGAVLIGDLWRWGIGDKEASADRAQFWRQFIRWLVSDTETRIQLDVSEQATAGTGRSMAVEIKALGPDFEPDPSAEISVVVKQPDGQASPVPLQIDFERSGHFTGVLPGLADGAYTATATLTDGKTTLIDETAIVIDTAGAEYRMPGGDRALLARIAEETGGEVIPAGDLDAFVETAPRRDAPVMTTVSLSLWHQAWIFLLALLLLAAEWFIRRRHGMA